ncbi:MAG: hypothetical protein K2W95_26180 [Candidatus Obscuribacterales bacterium]|nr:hypothetical protein [Candidatus Obscuribacterales bacterium]
MNDKVISSYLILQALGTACWWWCINTFPSWRALYFASGTSTEILESFFIADLCFYVTGSLICAFAFVRETRWRLYGLSLLTGAAAYATIFTTTQSCLTNSGYAGAACMLGSLLILCGFVICTGGEAAK